MKKKGFSLIELVVVMAVMGVLMALVLPSITRSRAAARDGKRKADLESARAALEVYRGDQPVPAYPVATGNPPRASGVVGGYLPSWPTDPLTNRNYRYVQTGSGSGYALCALLETETGVTTVNCNGAGNCGGSVVCNYEVTN